MNDRQLNFGRLQLRASGGLVVRAPRKGGDADCAWALTEITQLRSLLTAARAYVSREASGVGGAEARALMGEIDRVLGRDGA